MFKQAFETLFPKVCAACETPLYEGTFCSSCQSQIKLKTNSLCIVCSQNRYSCSLCYRHPKKIRPNYILESFESSPCVEKLLQSAYQEKGWRAAGAIADMLWAKFLYSCELMPTHVIALKDPHGFLGSSRCHFQLAAFLANRMNARALSWRRAQFYYSQQQDRVLLVGFETKMRDLITYGYLPKWQRALSLGVLIGLLKEDLKT